MHDSTIRHTPDNIKNYYNIVCLNCDRRTLNGNIYELKNLVEKKDVHIQPMVQKHQERSSVDGQHVESPKEREETLPQFSC